MSTSKLSYGTLTSYLLLVAYSASAAFQVYRATLSVNPAVDRFGVDTGVLYALCFVLAVAVRSERRVVTWVTAGALTVTLVNAVAGYYPTVYAARPMDVVDWLEGTVFTGLVTAALVLTVLRLAGATLHLAGAVPATAGAAGVPAPVGGRDST
jgi:hypothetical protein